MQNREYRNTIQLNNNKQFIEILLEKLTETVYLSKLMVRFVKLKLPI